MKKRILVIDDSPFISKLMKAELEESGFEVVTALDGNEGIKKAEEESPDLILLDVMMPEKDGFETLEDLKAQKTTKQIPVIMLSAKGDTSALFEGQELGAADYVIKGCEIPELLKCIKRHI